jgi:hypothetical protein
VAYFWRCPVCDLLYTFEDDIDPICAACFERERKPKLPMDDPALD